MDNKEQIHNYTISRGKKGSTWKLHLFYQVRGSECQRPTVYRAAGVSLTAKHPDHQEDQPIPKEVFI